MTDKEQRELAGFLSTYVWYETRHPEEMMELSKHCWFYFDRKHKDLMEQAEQLAEALGNITFGEPKDNATTYPHAENVLAAFAEFKKGDE